MTHTCTTPFLNSQWNTIISINRYRTYLPKTTYGPKFVDVHMFSEKLKDVTEKTNIRQFCKNQPYVAAVTNGCRRRN